LAGQSAVAVGSHLECASAHPANQINIQGATHSVKGNNNKKTKQGNERIYIKPKGI
jgi:hypothetical protein